MTGLGPAPGQAPGFIDPFGSNSELYHRANRYYDYGTDSRNLDDKRRAYQISIPLFREYLATGPQGDLVQQGQLSAWHGAPPDRRAGGCGAHLHHHHYPLQEGQMGGSPPPTGRPPSSTTARSGCRPSPTSRSPARKAIDKELAHKAIFYESRCLQMAGRAEQAIKRLGDIVGDNGNPYRDYARLAMGELYARQGKHEEALKHFELLLTPAVAPQERAQALLAAGVSAARLGQQVKAEDFLDRTLDSVGLDPKYKARAQLALMEMHFVEEDHEKNHPGLPLRRAPGRTERPRPHLPGRRPGPRQDWTATRKPSGSSSIPNALPSA